MFFLHVFHGFSVFGVDGGYIFGIGGNLTPPKEGGGLDTIPQNICKCISLSIPVGSSRRFRVYIKHI